MSEQSFSYLRAQLDSNDKFVAGGHGEIRTFGATRHAERMKDVPVWVDDDDKIRELLLLAFPKLKSDTKQKQAALIWVKIIHLYWRAGMTRRQVANAINRTEEQTHYLIRSISRVVKGQRADGTGPRTGKIGRPKKTHAPIEPTSGNSGGDSHISL